uniref:Tensin 3 n=1 Tax=Kryptolebias marmoratus TaxID=37003 RepID=A0A3Q3B2Z1_KRYMA
VAVELRSLSSCCSPFPSFLLPPSKANMEERRHIDLTYVTERIISVLCPAGCPEDIYLQNVREILPMLQSKHGHNYMLINLSQKHDVLTQMNHKVLDTGWLELHAPSLDQIFNVCTTMENWLQTQLKHVVVLHCRVLLSTIYPTHQQRHL